MIFLLNTKITDVRLSGGAYRRYCGPHYQTSERVEIFKYYLASHAVLLPLISKCIFYIELGPDLQHRQSEIEDYIKKLYPEDKLILHWYRNNFTRDWRPVCDGLDDIDDDLIMVATNDDHIFIDNSLDVMRDGVDILKSDPDPMAFIYYSHWPEQIRLANQLNAELTPSGNFVKYQWSNFDAVMVMKKARFKWYWFEQDFGSNDLYKIDQLLSHSKPLISTTYTPTKELVRHFDGYDHVGDFNNLIPPLTIPTGFFESNMKIRYGYTDRAESYINLIPTAEQLYAKSINGADYRWCISDIPLFWIDRIVEYDINPETDEYNNKVHRNHYFYQCTQIPMNAYYMTFDNRMPPTNWFKNHLLNLEN